MLRWRCCWCFHRQNQAVFPADRGAADRCPGDARRSTDGGRDAGARQSKAKHAARYGRHAGAQVGGSCANELQTRAVPDNRNQRARERRLRSARAVDASKRIQSPGHRNAPNCVRIANQGGGGQANGTGSRGCCRTCNASFGRSGGRPTTPTCRSVSGLEKKAMAMHFGRERRALDWRAGRRQPAEAAAGQSRRLQLPQRLQPGRGNPGRRIRNLGRPPAGAVGTSSLEAVYTVPSNSTLMGNRSRMTALSGACPHRRHGERSLSSQGRDRPPTTSRPTARHPGCAGAVVSGNGSGLDAFLRRGQIRSINLCVRGRQPSARCRKESGRNNSNRSDPYPRRPRLDAAIPRHPLCQR